MTYEYRCTAGHKSEAQVKHSGEGEPEACPVLVPATEKPNYCAFCDGIGQVACGLPLTRVPARSPRG